MLRLNCWFRYGHFWERRFAEPDPTGAAMWQCWNCFHTIYKQKPDGFHVSRKG